LREEHTLRVYENRVPRREDVTGDRIKLDKEDLLNFYASPDIIRVIIPRVMRWAGYVARMEEMRNG
jgi:hypothetical protein